jgi:mono/diheme cytochrome c family protein
MTRGMGLAAGSLLVCFGIVGADARQTELAPRPAAGAAPSAASISNGQGLFKRYCQGCHGETGKGDGPAAKFLKGKLPDLSDKTTLAGRTDADVHDVIANGKKGESGTMPPFDGRLKDPEIQDLIDFARSLGN